MAEKHNMNSEGREELRTGSEAEATPQPLMFHPVLSDGDTEAREAPAFFKVMAWNNEQFQNSHMSFSRLPSCPSECWISPPFHRLHRLHRLPLPFTPQSLPSGLLPLRPSEGPLACAPECGDRGLASHSTPTFLGECVLGSLGLWV